MDRGKSRIYREPGLKGPQVSKILYRKYLLKPEVDLNTFFEY